MTTADRRLDVSRSSGSGSGNKTARIGRPAEPQPQPPFVDRRRPNGIWSLITLALVMAQFQLFAHSGGGGCGVSAAPTHHSPTAAPSASSLLNPSKHLQKRSQAVTLPLSFRQTLNASSTQLDWENTCHMKPTGLNEAHSKAKRCKKRQKILQKLQNQTGRELKAIQDEDRARITINADHPFTNNTKTLDIVDKNKWRLHTENYNFLPRLNVTSKQLNLRHAHRDLQFYVGAFSYMRNIQWYWDVTIRQARTVLTDELGRLRKSAQAVLCSVEEAINVTNLLYTPRRTRAQQQPRGQKKRRQVQPVVTYKILPRKLMEKRLQRFNSTEAPLVELHHNATLAARGVHVALPPDNLMGLEQHALFTKLKFVQFLKGIRKILARQRRSLCKATAKGASKAIPMKEESRN